MGEAHLLSLVADLTHARLSPRVVARRQPSVDVTTLEARHPDLAEAGDTRTMMTGLQAPRRALGANDTLLHLKDLHRQHFAATGV